MKQLNRFDKYVLYYLVGVFPVILIFMLWAGLTDYANQTVKMKGIGWDIFGWVFILWVLDLFYIITKMLFSKNSRDIIMSKMAGVKERDERESVVAGNAAKFSFLSTFALLLFLLVFSVTTLSVTKKPENDPGKHGGISIGLGFEAVDKTALVKETKDGMETFNYKGFPLSKPMMVLIMMFWQIGSYHLIARRELKE